MSTKPKILVQLDTDPQPSVFDSVVAVDAGVEHLLRHASITPENVRDRVHGAIFTRGPADLHSTAIFVGGSDVLKAEAVLKQVRESFFGPCRVSVMLDPNGANTTAAAAVLAAQSHLPLAGARALVLASTGPVGQRVVRLLAREGAIVRAASRSVERAATVCDALRAQYPQADLTPLGIRDHAETLAALRDVAIVICASAAGIELVPLAIRRQCTSLRVAIDLNAVPPLGIEGVKATDRAVVQDGACCHGAIAVGGTKMKIHKAAIRRLFESNDQILDAEELFAIGKSL